MLFDKVNVLPILHGHYRTLRDNAFTNSTSKEDLLLFLGLPLVLSAGVLSSGFRFRIDAVNGFLNVFSILTGLLLNVLVLVLTLAAAKAPEGADHRRRARFIKEVFANICYAVLIAVVVVCVALIAMSYMRSIAGATTGVIVTFLLLALTTNFVLSLLMVLKRLYLLVDKDLRSDPQQKAA